MSHATKPEIKASRHVSCSMPRKTHATPANDINIPSLIFLLRFEEVIPGFTRVYMVYGITNPTEKVSS